MSITYEEALATLEAMFGEPWTKETLDTVLRHEKGHMENTCDRILNHGSKDPKILIDRLTAGGPEPQVAIDEELARQLDAQPEGRTRPVPMKKGRGKHTALPEDFLRIPGYKRPANATSAGAAMDDETLARMLQDELFSEELARNPDFAHLARGNRAASGRSNARMPPAQRRSGAPAQGEAGGNPFEGINVMQKVSELGDGAQKRFHLFAANFQQRLNNMNNNNSGGEQRGSLQEDSGANAERRGLLDDDGEDEDMIEFEVRKNQ